ncbi:MAG: imidazoleglycerol-phosphate dehydratase HisB [Chthoniobacterales bacterium]|jgi:imidazoleglycerol-phosphate dehydratase|nr:imidazoleglycerol-phosphate dehydratase HisB [Chthoniobacterales bacterium]
MTDTARSASLDRKTSETEITLRISLDGEGRSSIRTGIPFFDHMLTLFSRHGLVDLDVEAKGDIEVDYHHTVEDVGLALGAAFTKALGDKSGIRRYGSAYVPMDEALARVVVDCSGRPYLAYEVPRGVEAIGLFPFQLVEEFLRAFSVQAGLTLHVSILAGRDAHHMAEAIFKALGRALDVAVSRDDRVKGIPSTKGVL